MFSKLILVHVIVSTVVVVFFFATITRIAFEINAEHPDYKGEKNTGAFITSTIQMLIVSFIPIFNIIIFLTLFFEYDELKRKIEAKMDL